MRIVCGQTILMKNHALFFQNSRKMSQKIFSAVFVIGTLRAKCKLTQKEAVLPPHFV